MQGTFNFVVSSLTSKDLEIKVFDKGTINNNLMIRGRIAKRVISLRKSPRVGLSLHQRSMLHVTFVKTKIIIKMSVHLGRVKDLTSMILVLIMILIWFLRVMKVLKS